MEMTFEQALRPGWTPRSGMLHAFANKRGSGYMMRSEKRGGSYGNNGNRRRPPKRKKAGFIYIFFTLLISLILWPVGMVMLWRRKVRLQAGTKLLISLLTLCLSVFLIVFALMVPVDNPEYTAFQDRANDWLDKAAVNVAAAGDAAYRKGNETWHVMSDFAEAGSEYAMVKTADAVDWSVDIAGKARDGVVGLFQHEDTEAEPTEEPVESGIPQDTEAPAEMELPVAENEPLDTEAPAEAEPTEATDTEPPVLELTLPEATPDEADAQSLSEGALHADGAFEAGAEVTEEPTEAPTEEPVEATEEPVEATEEPVEATEEPVEATEEPVEATEAPTEEPINATEAPAESYTVKPAGEATVYYYSDGSRGFHRGPTRHGMGNAPAHTLAEAFAEGKNPCESCGMPQESILTEEHIAWVDEDNRIHTTDVCASFSGDWRLIPLAEAVDAGYEACPYCDADAYVASVYPAPTATPEPEAVEPATALKPAAELTVYFYDSSKGYHTSPSCVGMSNAPAHTLAEAVALGKRACGNCNPPAAELLGLPVLWLDDDNIAHTTDTCAAFHGAIRLIARDDALEQTLAPCPSCGASDYLVPGTVLAGE